MNGLKIEWIETKKLKKNPKNPRVIKDEAFQKLVKSIQEFPKMLEIRPIVIDKKNMVLGGSQRYEAVKVLEWETAPIIRADSLTKQEQERFILADNINFGEWDLQQLKEMDLDFLDNLGIDLSQIESLDLVSTVNEKDEWEGMPEFEVKEDSFKIIIHFDNERDREKYAKKNNMQFSKKESKAWSCWWPHKKKDDLSSLKFK